MNTESPSPAAAGAGNAEGVHALAADTLKGGPQTPPGQQPEEGDPAPVRHERGIGDDLRLVALYVVLAALAISTQSFWIDEASTALKAAQPSLSRWWQGLVAEGGSDLQMPFYMFYLWVWEKVFGYSEWWLRAANLPWLALGLLAVVRRQVDFVLLVAVSPFVWFYLDEARPYIMQVSCGLLAVGTLWRLAELRAEPGGGRAETLWFGGFIGAMLLLGGSSLLGLIWVAAAFGCAQALLGGERARRFARRHWAMLGGLAVCLAALAVYYSWTLTNPYKAITGSTGLSNLVFGTYEFLGLAGLGPGRLEIREQAVAAFLPFVPLLALQAGLTGWVLLSGWQQARARLPRRVWLGLACVLGGALALLLGAGVVSHVRILGRHAAPLAPVLLLLLAAGLSRLWERGGPRRAAVVVFILLNLVSAGSLRLAARHDKDDYRGAAAMGRAALAKGERVWWCAAHDGAVIYGLPISLTPVVGPPPQAWHLVGPTFQELTNQPAPHLLVLSKPDQYDQGGGVAQYLKSSGYQVVRRLPAFTFWRKEVEPVK